MTLLLVNTRLPPNPKTKQYHKLNRYRFGMKVDAKNDPAIKSPPINPTILHPNFWIRYLKNITYSPSSKGANVEVKKAYPAIGADPCVNPLWIDGAVAIVL